MVVSPKNLARFRLVKQLRQDAETIHGTQKPVECMRRPIVNNSNPGQCIYEPFLGSGTTLIAAESCGRVCLGIELSPGYVDVAVRRWQAFTGNEAVRENDGMTFNTVEQTSKETCDARPPGRLQWLASIDPARPQA
jgi:DNA modification methylase